MFAGLQVEAIREFGFAKSGHGKVTRLGFVGDQEVVGESLAVRAAGSYYAYECQENSSKC